MNHPLVSVIVPCYKVEQYLAKCVDSILGQTYENLEIWLVDDGSPDRCGEICDKYAVKDKRIKVIHKPNGGLSDARNVAIDMCRGEYIVFVDSDDYITSNHIETLYSLIIKYKVDIAASQFIEVLEGTSASIKDVESIDCCLDSKSAIESMFYQEKLETSAWGKIYHRRLFESGIRYPKGKLYEDLPTTYKLMQLTEKIAVTSKQTTHYLIRKGSIQGDKFTEKKNVVLNIGDELLRQFPSSDRVMHKAVCCRLLSMYFNIFFQIEKESRWIPVYWNRIRELRADVFLNPKARRKARLAALISYLGPNLTRIIYNLV